MLSPMTPQRNGNDQQTMTARLRSVGLLKMFNAFFFCQSKGVAMTGKVVAGQLMIIRADESIRIRIEENC